MVITNYIILETYCNKQIILIMKSSVLNYSYYMGLSCRNVQKSSEIMKILMKRNNSNPFQHEQNEQQKIKAIHIQRNKKKVQHIMKYQIPFIKRKQQQSVAKKNKRKQKDILDLSQKNTEYFKVTKIATTNNLKTQASENIVHDKMQNLTVELQTPNKNNETKHKTQSQKYLKNVNKSQEKLLKIKTKQKQLLLNEQNLSVFNHFPSQLFISPMSKQKLAVNKKAFSPSRTSNSFFPSSRTKTQIQRHSLSNKARNLIRPSTSKPSKKNSKEQRLFNFDGTLQNHKIVIPQRPKTSDVYRKQRQIQKTPVRSIEYHNYQYLAKKCIKLKNKKGMQRLLESGMKILPWNTAEQKINIDIFDISCSTIRGEANEQF